jgi:hypothetical protein
VLGKARAEVLLELRDQAEVAQARLVREQEPNAFREGSAAAEAGAPVVADTLRVPGGAEPRQRRIERGRIREPQAGGGHGPHASGGTDRVEGLVALAPLERSGQPVVLEQAREIALPRG